MQKLKHHPAARIRWPTVDEMRFFATLVNNREPSVDNVVGFVDGLSIAIMCDEDEESQATSYNGLYGDTRCSNVFAISPIGKIFYAVINNPGSWHDTQVAFPLVMMVLAFIGIVIRFMRRFRIQTQWNLKRQICWSSKQKSKSQVASRP